MGLAVALESATSALKCLAVSSESATPSTLKCPCWARSITQLNSFACTAFHCIALHSIAFHCIPLHSIAFHCVPLHSIALHCIALHCIALHCIALHCTALHCIALHCITLHGNAPAALRVLCSLPPSLPPSPVGRRRIAERKVK